MPSTFNGIWSPGQRFGSFGRKRRRNGAVQRQRHDRQLGGHHLSPRRVKLTMPPEPCRLRDVPNYTNSDAHLCPRRSAETGAVNGRRLTKAEQHEPRSREIVEKAFFHAAEDYAGSLKGGNGVKRGSHRQGGVSAVPWVSRPRWRPRQWERRADSGQFHSRYRHAVALLNDELADPKSTDAGCPFGVR